MLPEVENEITDSGEAAAIHELHTADPTSSRHVRGDAPVLVTMRGEELDVLFHSIDVLPQKLFVLLDCEFRTPDEISDAGLTWRICKPLLARRNQNFHCPT